MYHFSSQSENDLPDVSLAVDEDNKFKAHRLIIASSGVFFFYEFNLLCIETCHKIELQFSFCIGK